MTANLDAWREMLSYFGAAREAIPRMVAEKRALRKALETIADFAPGNGDVCEIIAKRARKALESTNG